MYSVQSAQALGGSFGLFRSNDSVSPTLVSDSAVISRLTCEVRPITDVPTHGHVEVGIALERLELAEHGLEGDGVRAVGLAAAEQRLARALLLQRAEDLDHRRLRLR